MSLLTVSKRHHKRKRLTEKWYDRSVAVGVRLAAMRTIFIKRIPPTGAFIFEFRCIGSQLALLSSNIRICQRVIDHSVDPNDDVFIRGDLDRNCMRTRGQVSTKAQTKVDCIGYIGVPIHAINRTAYDAARGWKDDAGLATNVEVGS